MTQQSNKTEKHLIESIGGVAHKNSGRNGPRKGDGTLGSFTVDVKEARSFGLNSDSWSKIVSDAVVNGNEPMLFVVLSSANLVRTKLAVIEMDTMLELMGHK